MAKSEMRAKDEKFQSSRHVHFSDRRIIPVRMLDHKHGKIFLSSQCCNLNVSERWMGDYREIIDTLAKA